MNAEHPRRGVIYVLGNPTYPGTLKIGKTQGSALQRARQLSRHTGVPTDFEVFYDEIVSDADLAEKEIHNLLADRRTNPRREFFKVPVREAIRVVQEVAGRYPVYPEKEAFEIELLPRLEVRMRRWLRRDIVSVKLLQFSDLCVLKWVIQPDVSRPDASERIFDLRVFAADDEHDGDHELFSPLRNTLTHNANLLLTLDAYSMAMTNLDILNEEAIRYVVNMVEEEKQMPPLSPHWVVTSRSFDAWSGLDGELQRVFSDD